MDLHSGQPWWLVKNRLYDFYNPLNEDLSTMVAIIGSGITGSLVANELAEAGIDCCVIDKRTPSTGSSSASTALLQYEIDVPLYKMSTLVGEQAAAEAYRACLQSISDISDVLEKKQVNAGFEDVPSLFYASDRAGAKIIEREYEARMKHGLPVDYLSKKEVAKRFGIDAPCALSNNVSAQVDAYAAATGLMSHNLTRDQIQLYTHTEVTGWRRTKRGYELKTDRGRKIKCKYLVIAAGFEAGKFLPADLMDLTTTYAIISEPVEPEALWYGRSLIWETREPYLYIRTDSHNRIIVGGEDERHNNPLLRRIKLAKKADTLEKKFRKLMDIIGFKTDMIWSGTFSSTRDGLPLIGSTKDDPGMMFALGYGGNGITFSMVAAQIISGKIRGMEDPREEIFGFSRKTIDL